MKNRLFAQGDNQVKFIVDEKDSRHIEVMYDNGEVNTHTYEAEIEDFRLVRESLLEDAETFVSGKEKLKNLYEPKLIATLLGITGLGIGSLLIFNYHFSLIWPVCYSLTHAVVNAVEYRQRYKNSGLEKSPSLLEMHRSSKEYSKYEFYLKHSEEFQEHYEEMNEQNLVPSGFNGDINELYDSSFRDVKRLYKKIKQNKK